MARATFGRAGQTIIIDESTLGPVAIIDDGSGETAMGDGESGTPVASFEFADGTPVLESETESQPESESQSGYTDPATATATGTSKPRRRRRTRAEIESDGGRPASTGTSGAKRVSRIVNANLTELIQGVHAMLAELTGEPEIAISDDEAQLLNDATSKLATEYGLNAVVSPKTRATVEFAVAIGTVYYGRTKRILRKHSKPKQPRVVVQTQQPITIMRDTTGIQ